MKTAATLAFVSLVLLCVSAAYADTFGSGDNAFDIEFVTIGNPGNDADTNGDPNPAGAVTYTYRIGKFEIAEYMISKANLESAATANPLSIIRADDADGPYGVNTPYNGINWNDAARFVNWLNTSTGSPPAYSFAGRSNFQMWQPDDAGYNPVNRFRNNLATYFLPSMNEWYKAAYYDPVNEIYYEYATGSNTPPTAVRSGTVENTAVYDQPLHSGPAEVTRAGGLSPYGTMAQNGNLAEWEETSYDLRNDLTNTSRGLRGIEWTNDDVEDMARSSRYSATAGQRERGIGFRVASISGLPSIPSDLTGDGFIDFDDLTILLAHWDSDVGAGRGNLVDPLNTPIDFQDLTFLLADWTGPGPVGSPEAALGEEAVPEPSSLVLALVAVLGVCCWRRRRRAF